MAITSIFTERKRWGNTYRVLRRFLTSNIGKNWDDLYSKICSVASADTYLGQEIRKAVEREVDTSPRTDPVYHDFYVDDNSILCKRDKIVWRHKFKDRQASKPILQIVFMNDENIWYEYKPVSEKWVWRDVKEYGRTERRQVPIYSKQKEWYQFTKKFVDESYPIYEYVDGKKGRQIGNKTRVKEEIHKRQCNKKQIKMLHPIAARAAKIEKLVYPDWESKGLIAYVKGKSK